MLKLKHLSTEFEYFTPKWLIFGLIQLGIIAYIFIEYMNYNCAKFYANISTNVNTTDIFPFLAIFWQIFFYNFTPKMAIFGPIQLCIIANIVCYIINYQYANFHAFIKKFTIDVIFRWL